ncbi:hypothetical protein INR49_029343, partial [Caranx melampygus]
MVQQGKLFYIQHLALVSFQIFEKENLVDVSRGHLGNFEDADGQRDGTQDKETVVDQDTGQDCMSDPPITADIK